MISPAVVSFRAKWKMLFKRQPKLSFENKPRNGVRGYQLLNFFYFLPFFFSTFFILSVAKSRVAQRVFYFIRVYPWLKAEWLREFFILSVLIRAYPWLKVQWLFYFFPNKAFKDLLKVTSAPVILAYIKPSSSCRNKFALRAVAEFLLTDMLR